MLRARRLLAGAALVSSLVVTTLVPHAQQRPSRAVDVDLLALRAASAPPEFAADLLIRLSGARAIADPAWKQELLDAAYGRAIGAAEPVRRAAPSAPTDTMAFALTRAYETGLDRTTLQTRIALAMSAIAPARARELFDWIPISAAPAPCEEALVPSLDAYYETLAVLARTTARADASASDMLQFLELRLWRAVHASEMGSILRAVQRYRPSAEELAYLETVLRAILQNGASDPRTFAETGGVLVSRAADVDKVSRRDGAGRSVLLHGLRDYLVTQTSGPRCADSVAEPWIVDSFNRLVSNPDTGLRPISAAEMRPSGLLGSVRMQPLWHSADARAFRERAAALFGMPRRPLATALKLERDWQLAAMEFVADVDDWTGRRERSAAAFLYQKAALLVGLVEIAPPSDARERAARAAAQVLRESAREMPRNLWFTNAERLLALAYRGNGSEQVREEIRRSGDPVMGLYLDVEEKR